MKIVDSQIHIWTAPTPDRPWDTSTAHVPHGPRTFSAERALSEMDAAGVDSAIIVPPSFEGDRNDLALAAAKAYPGRFLVAGRFPLMSRSVEPAILAAMAMPSFIGVRLTFNGAASRWIQDGVIDWFWQFAAENRVPVTLYPVGEQLQLLGAIAQQYPSLSLTVDHLATSTEECGFDHLARIDALCALAVHDNISVKASALPISFPRTYSVEIVKAVVDRLMPTFGPHRIFWGSDFTRTPTMSYGDSLSVFLDGISHLTPGDQTLIMGGAVREWFGFET